MILKCVRTCLPFGVLIVQDSIQSQLLFEDEAIPLKVQLVFPLTMLVNCTVILYQHYSQYILI